MQITNPPRRLEHHVLAKNSRELKSASELELGIGSCRAGPARTHRASGRVVLCQLGPVTPLCRAGPPRLRPGPGTAQSPSCRGRAVPAQAQPKITIDSGGGDGGGNRHLHSSRARLIKNLVKIELIRKNREAAGGVEGGAVGWRERGEGEPEREGGKRRLGRGGTEGGGLEVVCGIGDRD